MKKVFTVLLAVFVIIIMIPLTLAAAKVYMSEKNKTSLMR